MRLPDANILIYASDSSSRHHAAARAWMEGSLSGAETVGFALIVLLAFIRIGTSPRVMASPLAVHEAFEQVHEWIDQPRAAVVHPGPRHWRIYEDLLGEAGTAGNLATDAHLAALAIEHRARLASFDGDFHRFRALDLEYLH